MHTAWLKGVPQKNKEDRRREVNGYRRAFDDLKEILDKEFKKKPCVRDYEDPNWEIRQIAVNEYNQVLDDLLKLITLDKD
jgi:hypothetical protein